MILSSFPPPSRALNNWMAIKEHVPGFDIRQHSSPSEPLYGSLLGPLFQFESSTAWLLSLNAPPSCLVWFLILSLMTSPKKQRELPRFPVSLNPSLSQCPHLHFKISDALVAHSPSFLDIRESFSGFFDGENDLCNVPPPPPAYLLNIFQPVSCRLVLNPFVSNSRLAFFPFSTLVSKGPSVPPSYFYSTLKKLPLWI